MEYAGHDDVRDLVCFIDVSHEKLRSTSTRVKRVVLVVVKNVGEGGGRGATEARIYSVLFCS